MRKMRREQVFILIFSLFVFLVGGGIIISEKISNGQIIASFSTDSIYANIVDLESEQESDGSNTGSEDEIENQAEVKKILVHVAGEVINPGVYELFEGSRVIDAVELAGGATSKAELNIINLAAFISDGQQIYVPSSEESTSIFSHHPGLITDSGHDTGKVNINTANSQELQSLSGIGPGKAQGIIEYRNKNGSFCSPEDLLNVSGIGEKTFEKIKDRITVN